MVIHQLNVNINIKQIEYIDSSEKNMFGIINDASEVLDMGMMFYDREHYDESILCFKRIQELYPSDGIACYYHSFFIVKKNG